MALVQSGLSYVAGKYSDRLGRKPFVIVAGFFSAAAVLAYTFITSLWQLYALQVLLGLTQPAHHRDDDAGDYTLQAKRGTDVGKYHALTGVLGALAMMGGGYLVGGQGIEIIFYAVACFMLVSTIVLFSLREPSRKAVAS